MLLHHVPLTWAISFDSLAASASSSALRHGTPRLSSAFLDLGLVHKTERTGSGVREETAMWLEWDSNIKKANHGD